MILSLFFLFLMLLLISGAIFYLFCFFLPALRLKYEGISNMLSTELHFSSDLDYPTVEPDFEKVAVVERPSNLDLQKRLIYKGEKNCRLLFDIYSSEYKSSKVCIGYGDCVKVCPQQAISVRDNWAEISPACNGCGKCLSYCPVNLIRLEPYVKKNEEVNKKGFKFWSVWYKLFGGGIKVY